MLTELLYPITIGVFALMQGIAVAVIAGLFKRESKKREADNAKMDQRAKTRAEESRLSMHLMSANTKLACATGLAVKEGRTNGKMDAALIDADKAQSEYYAFINRVASTQMTAD